MQSRPSGDGGKPRLSRVHAVDGKSVDGLSRPNQMQMTDEVGPERPRTRNRTPQPRNLTKQLAYNHIFASMPAFHHHLGKTVLYRSLSKATIEWFSKNPAIAAALIYMKNEREIACCTAFFVAINLDTEVHTIKTRQKSWKCHHLILFSVPPN